MFEGSQHMSMLEKSKSVEKDVPLCFYAVCTLRSFAGLIN